MIRVVLPFHLRTLAQVDDEVTLHVQGVVTITTVLDALEAQYPVLRGTIRDHDTGKRRPFLRFFACEEDLSHEPPDAPLPEAVASGKEPFCVIGAIAVVLAIFAFHLLPINYMGVVLILLALAMFALEVKVTSHGALAVGGIVSMVIGAMILVDSPWPAARIHLSTALGVTIPLAVITVILVRLALAAQQRKVVTGDQGMVGELGVAQTELAPAGKVFVHGEIWQARAAGKIQPGTRVRVKEVQGLTLVVEPEDDSH